MHLGENVVVPTDEVVAILDGQLYYSSSIVQEYIEGHRKSKEIIEISTSMKTIIVTLHDIYFSPLASMTLKKRANQLFDQEQQI